MSLHPRTLALSAETVRQVALGIDRYRLMCDRHGRQAADTKRKPRGAGVTTRRPLERVELDHFLCDVHLVNKTGTRLGRPWLTLAVDHYSGMVVGYHLSFAPPSAASVLAALRHAILPKAPLPAVPEADPTKPTGLSSAIWVAYGIPDLLVVDNGLDLTSFGVREACNAMGVDLLFTPVRSPWYKGTIERFGGTANLRFIHWLPGTTLGRATSDLGYNAAEHALLTFEVFEALLHQYITSIHNKTPRRGKYGTPERRFLEGCQLWPVRVPDSIEEFDAAVALTRIAVLRQTGLHFLDLQYQNDELKELFNRSPPKTRLTFKVNPLDLKTVMVRRPLTNAFFPARCVTDHEWPRSLTFHMAVRQFARKNGLDTDDKRQLARAQRDLLSAIEDAAANSKRALRRMQAEVYRQGQDLEEAGDFEAEGVPNPNTPDDLIGDVFDEVFAK